MGCDPQIELREHTPNRVLHPVQKDQLLAQHNLVLHSGRNTFGEYQALEIMSSGDHEQRHDIRL